MRWNFLVLLFSVDCAIGWEMAEKFNASADGSQQHLESYSYYKELKGSCHTVSDCRPMAYVCHRGHCDCADGYKPDASNESCVGSIGTGCMYDIHCITKAYCKGQTICTCMEEYSYVAEDKWSCEDPESMASNINFSTVLHLWLFIFYSYLFII